MKKYLLGFIALGFLFALSAFTIASKKTAVAETQYWFEMNAAGDTPLSGPIDDVDILCPDKAVKADCARLYNESQTTGTGSSRTVISGQENLQVDFRTRK